MSKKNTLGRGLAALFDDQPEDLQALEEVRGASRKLAVSLIDSNPLQPRLDFEEAELTELAASIGRRGILQPLLVRRHPQDPTRYQLIAGERRWRAAQRAGLTEVPVTVQDLADDDLLEVALLENIQRQDLNPIEEALAYQQLLAQYGYAQEDLAKVVAKSRSHVANLLRLLNLPGEVQQLVRQGKLSMGHARALVTADDPLAIAKQIMDQGLSVRATERLVQGKGLDADEVPDRGAALSKVNGATSHGQMTSLAKDADAVALEQTLCDLLDTKVSLKLHNGRGAITIQYDSLEKLDFLLKRLTASGI